MPIVSSNPTDFCISFHDTDRVALIDGDPLVYRAAWACQKTKYMVVNQDHDQIQGFDTQKQMFKEYPSIPEISYDCEYFEGDFAFFRYVEYSPESYMKHTIKCMIQDIVDASKAGDYVLYLTGKGNFRNDQATMNQYKGNRIGKEKPRLYQCARDYMEEKLEAKVVNDMEADDALAIDHYQAWLKAKGKKSKCKTVLATIDKDLRQIPGWNYDLNDYPAETKAIDREPVWITELGELTPKKNKLKLSGLRGFYAQMLLGDVCDHIPGCKGYGPAKTAGLLGHLTTEEELYKAVLEAYRGQYGDYYEYYPWTEYVDPNVKKKDRVLKEGAKKAVISVEDMVLENARLLYMLRHKDDEWHPPTEREKVMTDTPETTEQQANAFVLSLEEMNALIGVFGELPYKMSRQPMAMLEAVLAQRGTYIAAFDVPAEESPVEETPVEEKPAKKPKKAASKKKTAKKSKKVESVFDEEDED